MPQLSCEQCRSRKTKCDKLSPCSSCKNAGLICHAVSRARLPRGKSSRSHGKKTALETRVARLESLLQQAVVAKQDCAQDVPAAEDSRPQQGFNDERLDGFVAPTFWTALVHEVAGIRDALAESDGENENLGEMASSPPDTFHGDTVRPHQRETSPIFPGRNCATLYRSQPVIDQEKRIRLLDIYQHRVDTVFKPLHWPTSRRQLEAWRPDTNTVDSMTALAHALNYMAVCTLSESECCTMFACCKPDLVRTCQEIAERAISSARVLCEPDIIGLQAFVIYLQALRTCRGHALNWTLLAVAARLATSLGLPRQHNVGHRAVKDTEIRARLWYSICLMDTQATLDRGSAPLIPVDDLGTMPVDCNDSDLDNGYPIKCDTKPNFTDMSFSIMTFKAMVAFRRISSIASDSKGCSTNWEEKLRILSTLEHDFHENYINRDTINATAMQHMTKAAASTIFADMCLLLRRPAYRQGINIIPDWDDFDPLEAATAALEGHIKMDVNRLGAWSWKEWTPWYALAVALAELCRVPKGLASDRAYVACLTMYKRYAAPASDRDQGMLWKPITKLLRRVNMLRGSTVTESPPTGEPLHGQSEHTDYSDRSTSFLYTPTEGGDMDLREWQRDFGLVKTMNAEHGTFSHQDFEQLTVDWDPTVRPIDLHPENGVSWLEWDLMLHDYENNIEMPTLN